MNTLNHLTLGEIEHFESILSECDLTIESYGVYLNQRVACLGNLIEYICFEAVQEEYKNLLENFKIIGDQIVCLSNPVYVKWQLEILNSGNDYSYAWLFLFHTFAQEKAA